MATTTIKTKKGEIPFDDFLGLELRDPVYAAELTRELKAKKPYLTYKEELEIAEGNDWIEQKLLAERDDLYEITQRKLAETSDYRVMVPLAAHTNVKEVWELCAVHCVNVRDAAKKNPHFGEILAVD